MARSNLTNLRLAIRVEDAGVRVEAAYNWTSSDDDPMSATRDITDLLTDEQRAAVAAVASDAADAIKADAGIWSDVDGTLTAPPTPAVRVPPQ